MSEIVSILFYPTTFSNYLFLLFSSSDHSHSVTLMLSFNPTLSKPSTKSSSHSSVEKASSTLFPKTFLNLVGSSLGGLMFTNKAKNFVLTSATNPDKQLLILMPKLKSGRMVGTILSITILTA